VALQPATSSGDSTGFQAGMSKVDFIGKQGFFGPLKPFTGAYHHSVYQRYSPQRYSPQRYSPQRYSRGGGGENAVGTLGKAFAYKRPGFSDGGNVMEKNRYNGPRPSGPDNDHGGVCTCWRCGGKFAKGGLAQMTPAWKDRTVCSLTEHATRSWPAYQCTPPRTRTRA
jgi:transcription elongation factor